MFVQYVPADMYAYVAMQQDEKSSSCKLDLYENNTAEFVEPKKFKCCQTAFFTRGWGLIGSSIIYAIVLNNPQLFGAVLSALIKALITLCTCMMGKIIGSACPPVINIKNCQIQRGLGT